MRRAAVLAAFLAVLAGLWAPAYGKRDRVTTESTLNVYRANPAWQIRADVSAAMDRADVLMVQEAYPGHAREAVRQVVHNRPNWVAARGLAGTELAITWDRRVWARVGAGHLAWMSPAKPGARYDRWLAWQALERRATGRVVTVANVHPSPAACRPGAHGWRVAYVAQHWRNVAAWTVRQRARHPARVILLGGDFNCLLSRRAFPWMPGNVLAPLFRYDRSASIDRLITSRGTAFPQGVRRWGVRAHSDHNAQFRRLLWRGP